MNEEKTEKRSPWRWVRRLFSLLLFLAILFLIVYLVAGIGTNGNNRLTGFLHGLFTTEETNREKYSFDAYSDNIFEEMNGGLVVLSSSEYQAFNASGELIEQGTKAFSHPAISAGKAGAVFFSQGGTDAMLLMADGTTVDLDTRQPIIAAAMNDRGYTAVSTEETGYKGLVTIYDPKGEPIYKWYSGSAYLTDASVTPSGTGLAALTLSAAGSRVVCYSFTSEEEQGSAMLEGSLCFDLDYLSENRICAVANDRAVFLNGKGVGQGEYSFDGLYLKDYSLDGSGFAVFVLGRYRTGGSGRIVSVNGSGAEEGSLEIPSEVRSLSVRGKYIAVVYSDSVVLYDSSLHAVGTIEESAGYERALAGAGGKLIAITGYRADEYRF